MNKRYTSPRLKRTFSLLVLIFRIFGLFPFWFNKSEKRFNASVSLFTYSIVALVAYVYFIGQYFWSTIWNILNQPAQYNMFLLFVSFASAYCGVIVSKLTILIFVTKFQRLLNDWSQLWNSLHSEYAENIDRKLLNMYLFKIFVIDGICFFGASSTRLTQAFLEHNTFHYYNAFYSAFNYSVESMLTNMIIGAAYLGGHYFRVINYKIVLWHKELHSLAETKTFRRPNSQMKRRLSKKLSKLIFCHQKVNQTFLKFMQLHDASMVLMHFKNFVVIIMGVFIACVTTVNELRKNQTPKFGIYGYLTVLSVFHIFQFYFVVASTALFTKRVSSEL